MNFDTFYSNLKNYRRNKEELTKLQNLYDDRFYKHTGVSGNDPFKIRVSGNQKAAAIVKLNQIEDLESLKEEINCLKLTIKLTKKYLHLQDPDIKELLIKLCLCKEKKEKVAQDHGYRNGVYLMRELRKAYRSV